MVRVDPTLGTVIFLGWIIQAKLQMSLSLDFVPGSEGRGTN